MRKLVAKLKVEMRLDSVWLQSPPYWDMNVEKAQRQTYVNERKGLQFGNNTILISHKWSCFHSKFISAPFSGTRTFCLSPCCPCQSKIQWILPFYTLRLDVWASSRQMGMCPDFVSIGFHSWPSPLPPRGQSLACQPSSIFCSPFLFQQRPDGYSCTGHP